MGLPNAIPAGGDVPKGRRLINPHVQALASIPLQAWSDYDEQYAHVSHHHDPSCRAHIIHRHMVHYAQQLDSAQERIKYFEPYDKQHMLRVGEQVIVRFKKLSGDLRCSNIPTQIQEAIRRRDLGQLEFFEDDLVEHVITVGYVPNDTWTGPDGMYIVERYEESLLWFTKLDHDLRIVDDIAPRDWLFADEVGIPPVHEQKKSSDARNVDGPTLRPREEPKTDSSEDADGN